MLSFINQNFATIVALVIVAVIVAFIALRLISKKKNGESHCGYSADCKGCPGAEICAYERRNCE